MSPRADDDPRLVATLPAPPCDDCDEHHDYDCRCPECDDDAPDERDVLDGERAALAAFERDHGPWWLG